MRLEDMQNRRLGRYHLIELIGRGGMAAVYRAHDTVLRRDVALKVLYPQYGGDESLIKRFQREAMLAAGLEHPNIVPIYDVGEAEGVAYIAMKLFDGRSLADALLAGQSLTLPQVVSIINQIADALDWAHARGVVHRDIKAGNILLEDNTDGYLSPADKAPHAMLTDFGIAKSLDAPGLTSTGILIGTPDYMAPEQISNRPLDGRADVYALGVLAFRCLTGRQPFEGNTEQVLLGHLNGSVPDATQYAKLPPAINTVLRTAMARDPDARYDSAGEFARALQAVARGEQPTPPPAQRRAFEGRAVVPRITAAEYTPPRANPSAATMNGPAAPPYVYTGATTSAQPARRKRNAAPWLIGLLFLLFLGGGGILLAQNLQRIGAGGTIPPSSGLPTEQPTQQTIGPIAEAPAAPITEAPSAPAEAPSNTTATSATEETPTQEQPTASASQPSRTTRPTNTPEPSPTADTGVSTSTPTTQPCPSSIDDAFSAALSANPALTERLGCPTEAAGTRQIVEQPFEFGSMLYVANANPDAPGTIYVVMRDTNTNAVRWQAFEDTWTEDEPEGGGRFSEGLYEPTRGFGKVWRDNFEIGQSLSYALAPEQGAVGVVQQFEGGLLVLSPVSDVSELQPGSLEGGPPLGIARGQGVYVLYGSGQSGDFEQYDE
jgi:serine/threonine-protein kinase